MNQNITFFCLCLISFSLNAQDLNVGLEVGGTVSFTLSETNVDLKKTVEEYENVDNPNLTFETGRFPKISIPFGFLAEYLIKDNMFIRSGMLFNSRGYNFTLSAQEKDPEFQFDQNYEYSEKFRVQTIEVPVSASFVMGDDENIRFSPGVILGFPRSSTAEIRLKSNQETIINGETALGLSEGEEERIYSYPDIVNGVFIGAGLDIDFRLGNHFWFALRGQYIAPYGENAYGNISEATAGIALKYSFNILD